jgi:hypothetical protein
MRGFINYHQQSKNIVYIIGMPAICIQVTPTTAAYFLKTYHLKKFQDLTAKGTSVTGMPEIHIAVMFVFTMTGILKVQMCISSNGMIYYNELHEIWPTD